MDRPTAARSRRSRNTRNFPQTEQTLPPAEIDLPVRSGVSKHTLVGLNIFLVKMAQQFADILGLRPGDPMLGDIGINPTAHAEAAILEQAEHQTATIKVDEVKVENAALNARVTVTNKVGHKFPSGVAFRRAFIEFQVLDEAGSVLWASGRTDSQGVIVDAKGAPIPGEFWWTPDCSARIAPNARIHQPHYQVISREDQAQIYEELISAPADVAAPVCGPGSKPSGRLTTSFLSGCTKVKDNRMLPHGFLKLQERIAISRALGADVRLAEESGSTAIGNDADYETGGGDTLIYRVPVSQLAKRPATVKATLYYQAAPPYYLQDRFCTSNSADTKRLAYLTEKLSLDGTPAEGLEAAAGRQRPGSGALVQQRRRGTAGAQTYACLSGRSRHHTVMRRPCRFPPASRNPDVAHPHASASSSKT